MSLPRIDSAALPHAAQGGTAFVYLSYCRGDGAVLAPVADLVLRLRQLGHRVSLDSDVPGRPALGWRSWLDAQLAAATHVLLVCSAGYERRASRWSLLDPLRPGAAAQGAPLVDAGLLRRLRDRPEGAPAVLPLVFDEAGLVHVPRWMRSSAPFVLAGEADFRRLNTLLTGRAEDGARTLQDSISATVPVPLWMRPIDEVDPFADLDAEDRSGAPAGAPAGASVGSVAGTAPGAIVGAAPGASVGVGSVASMGAVSGAVSGAASDTAAGARHGRSRPPGDPASLDALLSMPPSAPAAAAPPAEPVWYGAGAPRAARAGQDFACGLVVYTAARRASALAKLGALGEAGDRQLGDIEPDSTAPWRPGAPVTVTLGGRHVTVTPPQRHFDWSGRENLAAFSVTVDEAAPAGRITLHFQVLLAGVPMGEVPLAMDLLPAAEPVATGVGTQAPADRGAAAPDARIAPMSSMPPATPASPSNQSTQTTQAGSTRPAPRSAFASYASRDAVEVGGRLSTLQRWAPGLSIFQDCLDLLPSEDFKPQLEREIAARDVFLLFWSGAAAASPWVHWEIDTARRAKGLQAILPMPLEDPALVQPPAGFEQRHWRDRFLVARTALAAIAEKQAAR